jgi:hypothetical protein
MTDYETRLERMTPHELLNELEDAHSELDKNPKDAKQGRLMLDRYRIARRVAQRRLTLASNLVAA